MPLEVSELAGIKERSCADGALLEMNARGPLAERPIECNRFVAAITCSLFGHSRTTGPYP
jgi:hypothetical protein